MTRENANNYKKAINDAIERETGYSKTCKALKILINEYGLYYDEKNESEYKNPTASKLLSKLLEDYVVIGEYVEGKIFKTRKIQITHFIMPDEICKSLEQKADKLIQCQKDEINKKIEEEVNDINTIL